MAAAANPRDRMLILLLWATGGRVTEVIRLRVGDVTETGVRMVNLKQRTPSEKHVFVSPAVLEEIREYCRGMAPEDPIIQSERGGPICRVTAWRLVTAAGRRAFIFRRGAIDRRLRPMSPKNYRHGHAIRLMESGVPINAVQRNLGHSSVATTSIYTELVDRHRQAMIAGVAF